LRRLIINADDFGLTAGVNRGILEAGQSGVVSSATLMSSGRAFTDAVQFSKSIPKLSVGCHIVLTDGLPIMHGSQIPTLVDRGRARFRESLARFIMSALAGRLNSDQIEQEAIAQIHKLQSAGIVVSHFDTHKHTHLFPQVLKPLLRAAIATGVPAVRNPFGPAHFGQAVRRPALWKRYGQVKVLCFLAKQFRKATGRAGLKTPDGTLGIVGTGDMDEALFRAVLNDLPEGTWEFVCHPGYCDDDLRNTGTRLRESRALELRVLTSIWLRELLTANGIELISYRDLTGATS
jgi:hopanoid biosynthesis associated protein HpnK